MVPYSVPFRVMCHFGRGRFGGRLKTGKAVSDDPFGRFI
ncbi:hypothetical protein HMPREF1051_0309 [Neisseria sicca VK64]|uniref:Uncharacterized protein n=1 Tax=Neisseria sicca VK64 TaxID=1095748 RepID=I2NWG5_NEISI|nr:hypothetical protein HMPREF1051_0309 [Neisseria sicca VK64]